jgi:hypothetical protein
MIKECEVSDFARRRESSHSTEANFAAKSEASAPVPIMVIIDER